MKKITLYSFLMLLVFFSCKQEEEKKAQPLTMGQLTISKEQPSPGDEIELIYNSKDEVEAFYAYMVDDKNYPLDIDFSEKDGEQKGSIKIPDSAVALAFIIKADDKFDDNNKKGYLLPLYTKDGKQIQGSNAATSYYAVRYGNNYGIEMDEKEAAEAINADLNAHPELKANWEVPYLQLAYKNDKEEAKKRIDAYAASIGKKTDVSEKEYTSMMQFYNMTGEQTKYDSIKNVALEKFPNGNTANYEMVELFQKETDLEKKADIFKNYADANAKLGNIGNYMAGTLTRTYYQ